MSIASASVNIDGTSSTTGGTDTGMVDQGGDLLQHQVILDDSSEFIDQTSMLFSITPPKPSSTAPNGYTQKRCKVIAQVPLALDNGNYTVNTLRLELACDPETTDSEIQSMLILGGQLLSDSDFSDFWKKQSVE
jgi:hypothetical protein